MGSARPCVYLCALVSAPLHPCCACVPLCTCLRTCTRECKHARVCARTHVRACVRDQPVTMQARQRVTKEVWDEITRQTALGFKPGDPIHPHLRQQLFRLQVLRLRPPDPDWSRERARGGPENWSEAMRSYAH